MRIFVFFVLVACLLAGPARAQTPPIDPPHIAGMPSVEQVLAAIDGSDARDSALRQTAALRQLRAMIEKASGGRAFSNDLTAGEQRLMSGYGTAASQVRGPIQSALSGQERARWFADLGVLESSDDYRDELLERLFSAE